jgi:cell division protein FtsI (penicillin-binding protein 3)
MEQKKDIMWRVYVVYFFVCLFGIGIMVKVFALQVTAVDENGVSTVVETTRMKIIEPTRGNIYADDGSLLATSIPEYSIFMDVATPALTDTIWGKTRDVNRTLQAGEVLAPYDSLAYRLSQLFNKVKPGEIPKSHDYWTLKLNEARAAGKRYHKVKSKVDYDDLKALKNFPLFRRGQNRGGLIIEQKTNRKRPFQLLAQRTVGYDRYESQGIKPVGLEGAYRSELKGIEGRRLEKRISGNNWMAVSSEGDIEPRDGDDVITTININYQDVVEASLLDMLKTHNADHGCVVLMEVETGHVKAIANLRRDSGEDTTYSESYNYAVGESTEPGSTFKLLTAMSLMEHGHVKPTDSIDCGDGKWTYYDHTITDSKYGGHGKITFHYGFEVSSNICFAKSVNKYYENDQARWTDQLFNFGVNKKLGLEIAGEGAPYIKVANSGQDWSGISHTQMAFGYECQMTPFQTLAYYNAVANGGKMVKPMFVSEIRRNGEVVRTFETEVLNPALCSEQTVKWLQDMCEGVVTNGTGNKHPRSEKVRIAGKTGTARIANSEYGYDYGDQDYSHQASFVGYFPADAPRYSCIVVINAPKGGVYYGAKLAGPVFREIAEKVNATDLAMHAALDPDNDIALLNLPISKNGMQSDLQEVFAELDVPTNMKDPGATWVKTRTLDDEVELHAVEIDADMPDVMGMGLMDAIYLLENRGKRVKVIGRGFVKSQRVDERNPNIVILELS